MEIKDWKLEVTNIKISVKLPFSVSLSFVEDRIKSLQSSVFNINCSRKNSNILTIRYNNFTYILFKSSSKIPLRDTNSFQHCNITKIKAGVDIPKAIQSLFFVVDQPEILLDYSIDNYSCCGDIFKKIDIESLFVHELQIVCDYNEENFPAVIIHSPIEYKKKSTNLCCLLYRTGRFVLVGGKDLEEIEEFFKWVFEIAKRYIK